MKKNTLLTVVAATMAAGAAFAGSPVPHYEEPVPYIPMEPEATWEGFYAGVLGGFQTGDLIETTPNITTPFQATTYGVMAGYNLQKDNFVFGGEIDVQFGKGSLAETDVTGAANAAGDFDVNYLVDLRARLGYAFDNVLFYAAGGYTTTKITQGTWNLNASGWNLGAGIDLAVNDDFFVGGEYIYRNLSGEDNFANPYDLNTHGVQLRAGYRF